MITELILYSLIGGLFSLVGAFIIIWKEQISKRFITILLSFAAGAFLAAAFLDVLPEAVEMVDEPHPIFLATLIGFILFFILERFLMRFVYKLHEGVAHSDHTESLPFLVILGDSIHNFLDGIVIALAYLVNPSLGLITALAIAGHEVPQEIGDASIFLNQGFKKSKIILINVLQSLLTIPGVLIGFYLGSNLEGYLPYLLGATAGIFLYISASDLIPEIHHSAGHKDFLKVILPLVLSIFLVWYLVSLAHG